MKRARDIEAMIKDLRHPVDARAHDRVLGRLLDAWRQRQQQRRAVRQPRIGRIVMKNPTTKLALAAAIIVAVILGLFEFIDTGGGSGVVWAEVAKKVQASRGVIFRSTEHIAPDTYDQENDYSMQYCTSTQSRLDGYQGGRIIKTIWGDCNTKTVVLVDHFHKSYIKETGAEMPDRLGTMDPNSWVQKFLSCQYKKLGRKTIEGVLCEGIETTDPAFYGGGNPPETPVARLWVSVETGYPVQFEGERVYDDQRHTWVQDQFQWDVAIDPSLFEPNIPADYLFIPPPH
jgi:hypothetical protein